ncbi:MAG: alpha/beta hydrolase [Psychroflexus sp.]|uniref:Alpha/beta hydrolase n=2 Tax=Mesohalobacter halotolerans TaxID=1883405 RepID=A0A4V6ALB7_9FLAO|nr:alpha/beta hydrolase [Psychroflexus sp.]TKS55825.1 alpha/beta hydrolase [Mesohalobacter halotolerans]
MPGMAANPSIFEHIKLDNSRFDTHWLSWQIPIEGESIQDYAQRMLSHIKHEKPILIGVSFGGVLVQEIAKLIEVERLIIISSVKQSLEIPKHMKLARETGVYKYLPFGLLNYINEIEKLPVGNIIRKRLKLYKQYLSVNDKVYLDWAVKEMVCWNQNEPMENVIHIHGDMDKVFSIKNIKQCIIVKDGTHIMILNRFRWFNEHLPELIEHGIIKEKNNVEN